MQRAVVFRCYLNHQDCDHYVEEHKFGKHYECHKKHSSYPWRGTAIHFTINCFVTLRSCAHCIEQQAIPCHATNLQLLSRRASRSPLSRVEIRNRASIEVKKFLKLLCGPKPWQGPNSQPTRPNRSTAAHEYTKNMSSMRVNRLPTCNNRVSHRGTYSIHLV